MMHRNFTYKITRGTRVYPDICLEAVWNGNIPAHELDLDHPLIDIHRMKTVKAKWLFMSDDVLLKGNKSWLVKLPTEAPSHNCFWVKKNDVEHL